MRHLGGKVSFALNLKILQIVRSSNIEINVSITYLLLLHIVLYSISPNVKFRKLLSLFKL